MASVRIFGRYWAAKNIRMSHNEERLLDTYSGANCSFDMMPPAPPELGGPSGAHIELGSTFDIEVEVPGNVIDLNIGGTPIGTKVRRVMMPDGKSLDALGVMLCVWNGVEGFRIIRQNA